MSSRRLALDGPSNGQYITPEEADDQGYREHKWPTLEKVWIHGTAEETLSEDFDPDPTYTLIIEAVYDAEVR